MCAKTRRKTRAWVFCLWVEGFFRLDFLLLLYQDKGSSLRGNERDD